MKEHDTSFEWTPQSGPVSTTAGNSVVARISTGSRERLM